MKDEIMTDDNFEDDENEQESMLNHLEEEHLGKVEDDIIFERALFEAVAQTDNFDVLPIFEEQDEDEKSIVAAEAKRTGTELLFRVSNGTTAVIFGTNGGKVAIVPEDNPHGFHC